MSDQRSPPPGGSPQQQEQHPTLLLPQVEVQYNEFSESQPVPQPETQLQQSDVQVQDQAQGAKPLSHKQKGKQPAKPATPKRAYKKRNTQAKKAEPKKTQAKTAPKRAYKKRNTQPKKTQPEVVESETAEPTEPETTQANKAQPKTSRKRSSQEAGVAESFGSAEKKVAGEHNHPSLPQNAQLVEHAYHNPNAELNAGPTPAPAPASSRYDSLWQDIFHNRRRRAINGQTPIAESASTQDSASTQESTPIQESTPVGFSDQAGDLQLPQGEAPIDLTQDDSEDDSEDDSMDDSMDELIDPQLQGQFATDSKLTHCGASQRFIGEVTLAQAHLGPDIGLPEHEIERRFQLIDRELVDQLSNPPMLPPSGLVQQGPKEFVGTTWKAPEGVDDPGFQAFLDEQNRPILQRLKTIDLARNNVAAKGTRNRRDEALAKYRRLTNDIQVELNWWRLKATSLGADPQEWEAVPQPVKIAMADDMDNRVQEEEDRRTAEDKKIKSRQHSNRNSDNARRLKSDAKRKEKIIQQYLTAISGENGANIAKFEKEITDETAGHYAALNAAPRDGSSAAAEDFDKTNGDSATVQASPAPEYENGGLKGTNDDANENAHENVDGNADGNTIHVHNPAIPSFDPCAVSRAADAADAAFFAQAHKAIDSENVAGRNNAATFGKTFDLGKGPKPPNSLAPKQDFGSAPPSQTMFPQVHPGSNPQRELQFSGDDFANSFFGNSQVLDDNRIDQFSSIEDGLPLLTGPVSNQDRSDNSTSNVSQYISPSGVPYPFFESSSSNDTTTNTGATRTFSPPTAPAVSGFAGIRLEGLNAVPTDLLSDPRNLSDIQPTGYDTIQGAEDFWYLDPNIANLDVDINEFFNS
ncbi:hypothetical protein FHETE_1085 [Fusarium heterosporum]|uniref:Uncharacterized protein n=1 Tax=Fusarium heterosporum TaxID=42747 RepID=A0A8H5X2K0_FUSHE|nr:hypothetical protein FHETE_1085 [Fusarium heterosporum]